MKAVLKFGKGLLKALFIGVVAVGAFIMNCIELHRSNDLCDHGMRGYYGKERRYADPPRAPKL